MSNLLLGHNIENKFRTDDVQIQNDVHFSAMLLSQPILQSLTKNGFRKPSPIQLKAIPMGRFGYDLIVKSKSGTGKTAVFSIIALEMIDVSTNNIQVLVVAPTREIAVQIQQVIVTLGEFIKGLKVKYFIGGTTLEEDFSKLKHCHIAVGAPGRVKALIKAGQLKTDNIRLFILDEADKLLETSFQSDINYIYNSLPNRKQVIAASATYPEETKQFLSNYMQTPTIITPNSEMPVLIGIKQYVSVVKSHLNVVQQMSIKNTELIRILQTIQFTQCIIFCNYQNRAETLSNNLNRLNWPCVYVSGAQKQKARLEAVQSLKEFKCRILSTTDLTARGIDAANLDLVINYEVPHDSETYLHRMGRAGRYGSNGVCVTIAADGAETTKLQKMLGEIGGTIFSIDKVPAENLTVDFWCSNPDNVEKLFGVVDCNDSEQICSTLKELSVTQNDPCSTLNSLEPQKNELNQNDIESMLNNLNKTDETQKTELKSKLGNLNADSIIEMLTKGNVQKSKSKKIRTEQTKAAQPSGIHNLESCSKNIQFENEADMFQKNNIAKKNIALFNITKYVIEEETITEENVEDMRTLLESLKNEDRIITNVTESNTEVANNFPQWVTVREYEITDTGNEICCCHQNIFTNCYSYVLSKTDKHWKDTLCKQHQFTEEEISNEEKIVITKEEFLNEGDFDEEMEDEYYDEDVEDEYYDEEMEDEYYGEEYNDENEEQAAEETLVLDEDILVKAYDYALHSEVKCGEVSFCESSNEDETADDSSNAVCGYGATQTYPHLQSEPKSRKRSLENTDSSNENSVVDHQNSYESYFDYYHESLCQNAPYFYDVESFEHFFDEWQQNVLAVRNFVQEDIYAKENKHK